MAGPVYTTVEAQEWRKLILRSERLDATERALAAAEERIAFLQRRLKGIEHDFSVVFRAIEGRPPVERWDETVDIMLDVVLPAIGWLEHDIWELKEAALVVNARRPDDPRYPCWCHVTAFNGRLPADHPHDAGCDRLRALVYREEE